MGGIFDVTVGINGYKVTPLQDATTNTTNLQYLANILLDSTGPTQGNGGTLQFPSVGTYQFNDSITVGADLEGTTRPFNIILMGTGQQQANVPLLEQIGDADLFVIATNNGDDLDVGGVVFQDLLIAYSGSGATNNAAIHVKDASQSMRAFRVTLRNWPVSFLFAHSYRAAVDTCTIHIGGGVTYPTIGLQLGDAENLWEAIETYVAGLLILDDSNLGTAIQVYGCEHARVLSTRLQGSLQGIAITPAVESGSAKKLYFANVSCFPYSPSDTTTGAAVIIQTSGNADTKRYVAEVTFAQCEFTPPAAGTTYTGGGVVIDPTGPIDVIDQIRFVDCHSCLWKGPGMNIAGGTNIEVLGGYYSCNGTGSVPYRTGIAITGPASGVRITGAACNNSLFDSGAQPPAYAALTQNYGVEVAAAATSVRVNSCDLTGNMKSSVFVNGGAGAPRDIFVKGCDCTGVAKPIDVDLPVTNLQVTDCPGYNDQGTVLGSTVPSPQPFSNISSWTNAPDGWFGPIAFYVTGTGHVTIDVTDTTLTAGGFTLNPGETAKIAGTPSTFLAIGK